MDLRDELRSKWNQAAGAGRADLEWRAVLLSQSAPLRILAAVREPDERAALLFETALENAPARTLRLQADGISLLDQRRPEEGIVRLAITLEQESLRDVFEVLVQDLIGVASRGGGPQAALALVIRRLEAWQACLRLRRQRLSREQQIGLMGELAVYRMIVEVAGHAVALEAWQGPLDAIHDFSRVGHTLEVKTSIGIGSRLTISHLDQLDSEGLNTLTLARVRFREDADGLTLGRIVEDMRCMIGRDAPEVLNEFNDRVLRAGFVDLNRDEGEEVRAALADVCGYDIRDGFPRLTATTVPAGIVDASYLIDERSIAAFRLDESQVRSRIAPMKGGSG